jgi:hypothetical protein
MLIFAKNRLTKFKHLANNTIIGINGSKIIRNSYFEQLFHFNEIKTILKKCPNIKCLQIKGILINESLIEWISNNCKQLVCIHLFQPKSVSDSPQIDFKQIGKLLSDKVEIEINFGNDFMKINSIIALILNMPQIKDIGFCLKNSFNFRQLLPYFGQNIRSLFINDCFELEIEDLKVIKNNTNLVELSVHWRDRSQHKFDFICDNFTQLKSFCFMRYHSLSISQLIKLVNLQNLEIVFVHGLYVNISSMDNNNYFNKSLKSLKLCHLTADPILFEDLLQMFPNIENLTFDFLKFFCQHLNNENYDCFQCWDQVFNYLSKLNRLKVLEIIHFNCAILKAIESNINEQTFKELVELKLCIYKKSITVENKSKQIFIDLIQSLTQLCDRNTKQLFTLKIDEDFVKLITEKKRINGVKYNVFFDCEKFEKKFEIPKNMRIIRDLSIKYSFFTFCSSYYNFIINNYIYSGNLLDMVYENVFDHYKYD